jgi:hypothetical protein
MVSDPVDDEAMAAYTATTLGLIDAFIAAQERATALLRERGERGARPDAMGIKEGGELVNGAHDGSSGLGKRRGCWMGRNARHVPAGQVLVMGCQLGFHEPSLTQRTFGDERRLVGVQRDGIIARGPIPDSGSWSVCANSRVPDAFPCRRDPISCAWCERRGRRGSPQRRRLRSLRQWISTPATAHLGTVRPRLTQRSARACAS